MKEFVLTFVFAATALLSHAQGTIAWGNSALTRILVAPLGGTAFSPSFADGYTFSLYYGPAGSGAEQLAFSGASAQIGDVPGVLTGASSVLAFPGTEAGQAIMVQIRATHPAGLPMLNPPVRQITLGQTAGPGAVIWTADPDSRTFTIVPEPGSLAVAGIAGLVFGVFRSRRR